MNLGECWQPGVWSDGSWVDGAWCPATPPPPVVTVREEPRRWPGPSTVLYSEDNFIPRIRREEDEAIIL